MRNRFYSIISIPLFALLYFYTALVVLVAIVFVYLKLSRPVSFISHYWAKSVFVLMGKRFRVYGIENIDPGKKYILVANHASLFDIVAIMSFYPGIAWFGHERLLKIPVFGKMLRLTDYIPFMKPGVNNTKYMMEQLSLKAARKTVAIFPEGTRTLDGNINEFYRGFVYLLRNTESGILPVTLNGFYKLKPKNRSYINFDSKLDVVIHKPISKEELVWKSDPEIIDEVRSIIESVYQQNMN
jgi:1-acyl-sn-glycerol-3-phosphate acyltransferase